MSTKALEQCSCRLSASSAVLLASGKIKASREMDPSDRPQVQYWGGELGVDPEVVQYAVDVLGPGVDEVRRYLDLFRSGTRGHAL